jgi:6-phosphogluconate dehydrogenase
MKIGIIGLGRMGSGISKRLKENDIHVSGYDVNPTRSQELESNNIINKSSATIENLITDIEQNGTWQMGLPRIILILVPAENVQETLNELIKYCSKGDIIVDMGNSNFKDSRKRAIELAKKDIDFIDCGTSGGVHGVENGYCLMIGGKSRAVTICSPIFKILSPGLSNIPRTNPDEPCFNAEYGFLYCGESGAGHFVKMVHNGIEYGIMQAYAEGFNLLREANGGKKYVTTGSAEIAPMEDPESYCYDFKIKEIAELWRRGSIIKSYLLDLTAKVLNKEGDNLDKFGGSVSDSGEARWFVKAGVDLGVPTPVVTTSLYQRFNSRFIGDYAKKILNSMRFAFGGHQIQVQSQ